MMKVFSIVQLLTQPQQLDYTPQLVTAWSVQIIEKNNYYDMLQDKLHLAHLKWAPLVCDWLSPASKSADNQSHSTHSLNMQIS